MAASARAILQAREVVQASRPSSGVRPHEGLPRRLQACMQEVMSRQLRQDMLVDAHLTVCRTVPPAAAYCQ